MDAKKLIKKLENEGFRPRSYSGRGMYGKKCVAVTSGESDGNLPTKGMYTDQLGLGYIYYWPAAEWPDERRKD